MVPSIFLVSTERFSGKTILSLGLGLKLKEEGYNVGYFKPVGWRKTILKIFLDEDVVLFQKVLELKEDRVDICPVILDRRRLEMQTDAESLLKAIHGSYEKVAKGKDILLIEGAESYYSFSSLGLSDIILARELNSNFLFITGDGKSTIIDDVLLCKNVAEKNDIPFLGSIINNVSRRLFEKVIGQFKPILINEGINVYGIVPREITLFVPTVAQIHERLGGEVLVGEENLDNLVEDYLVGAISPESASRYFRGAAQKAVVIGGDRADVAIAALEADPSVLILTGNLYPASTVLALASTKEIPVLLVPYDTFTTVKRFMDLHGVIDPKDQERLLLIKNLVEKYVDWQKLYEKIQ